jgi:hypothetical protein
MIGAWLRVFWDVFLPRKAEEVRLKVRTNSRVEVPIGQKHWSIRS